MISDKHVQTPSRQVQVNASVMAGFVQAIHVFLACSDGKTWMPAQGRAW